MLLHTHTTLLELIGGIRIEFGHMYLKICMETWIQAALIVYIAVVVTTFQILIWVILLVSDKRALGQDFTELVHLVIFKPVHIPR
jgi:hypothetical protein